MIMVFLIGGRLGRKCEAIARSALADGAEENK